MDSYDSHMIRYAADRRPVLVRHLTPHGQCTETATLLGWRTNSTLRGGRYARVRYPNGRERTVRQADIILPDGD